MKPSMKSASEPGQAPPPGRAGGVGEGPVLVDEALDDGVVAQPAAGFGWPGGQAGNRAVVEHPGLRGQFVVLVEDQCCKRAPAQVGGADTFAAVAASQGNATLAVAQHVRAEASGHAQVAPQEWVMRTCFSCGKSSLNR